MADVGDPEFVAHVHAIHRGEIAPPPIRDAATVVLVRDGVERSDGRLEVFLMRRVATMAFGAGMHVFPGGRVEEDDDVDPAITLPEAWAQTFTDGDARALRRVVGAAVRETREEAGVEVDPRLMQPFAHWVTPSVESRRYDTRFLLCALPSGQDARITDRESDRGFWAAPAFGLTLLLMPPTQAALADLATCADVAAAFARTRDVTALRPDYLPDGDGIRFSLDGT